jgi:GDP-4-dehydro-6-deoxy-D-mannose reductase
VRVLVTGAAGFVGSHLLPRLASQGHDVVAVDREVDVGDAQRVARAVSDAAPQGLIHLAGISSVAASRDQPVATWRTNYVGARNILEGVRRRAPDCHVLLVGSGEIYGLAAPGQQPFDEHSAIAPRSPYACAKACADRLGGAYARLGLRVARLRPFNHTGPGQSEHFAAGSFTRQAAEIARGLRKPVLRVGNLDSTRDFLDVEDVVAAYCAVLETGTTGVFNVASGTGRRIGDLLERLLAVAEVAPEIVVDPARVRPTDCSVGNSQRLQRATGWRPRVGFDETLSRMFEDAQARLEAM